MRIRNLISVFALLILLVGFLNAQHSVAREWNEELLEAIRNDFARPTVHARNLFHTSVVMYDAWAIYDTIADPYLLDNENLGFSCPIDTLIVPEDIDSARQEAISYAAYRLLYHRFSRSPRVLITLPALHDLFVQLGYDSSFTSTDYTTGSPAALGNYIAECMINYGFQDGANEQNGYENQAYQPVNPPLVIKKPGNPDIEDFNRWQPITLDIFIDQAGNEIPFDTPDFLSPEWGIVKPFALSEEDLTIYERDGFDYWVYHDPGNPCYLDTTAVGGLSEEYKWGQSLVAIWSSHLDPANEKRIDISPASIGNIQDYPTTIEGLRDFYNYLEGGDPSIGHSVNPKTGLPYVPQMIKLADYGRVLAEFWADGPDSETPPGHWFTILNYVNDHPDFQKQYRGQGNLIDDLEWDIKAYLLLGTAMHDVAISSWGIKGWYDYIRPVSAIRGMAELGQSSDTLLPSYHPGGIHLVPGYIELVTESDALVGDSMEHLNKIKLYAWRGPDFIADPDTSIAGVDWILAENWWPYQRPSFVTPPFAGYISGHSTYSRAAAEVMTMLTGDPFFPGGIGEFIAEKNEFLVFEEGPSEDVVLQWATYRDASDQTSLSRIWGGIHPPVDDIPGRLIGIEIGLDAFALAEEYFFNDQDKDGFYNFEDCNDEDDSVYPGAPELCDGKDNNCSGAEDDGLPIFTYYFDFDEDGFGDIETSIDTCASIAPPGFVSNSEDCNDEDNSTYLDAPELCDGKDNNCSGAVDDGLPIFTYYFDFDEDGFGDIETSIDTCASIAPPGFVSNSEDCNDEDNSTYLDAPELCDGKDNNCSGAVDDGLPIFTYYFDFDEDGFGDIETSIDTCASIAPPGFVTNSEDCNDDDIDINPDAEEVEDDVDNNCNGEIDEGINNIVELSELGISMYPNPVSEFFVIESEVYEYLRLMLYNAGGKIVLWEEFTSFNSSKRVNMEQLPQGLYFLFLENETGERAVTKILKY